MLAPFQHLRLPAQLEEEKFAAEIEKTIPGAMPNDNRDSQ